MSALFSIMAAILALTASDTNSKACWAQFVFQLFHSPGLPPTSRLYYVNSVTTRMCMVEDGMLDIVSWRREDASWISNHNSHLSSIGECRVVFWRFNASVDRHNGGSFDAASNGRWHDPVLSRKSPALRTSTLLAD
jgi:hypothetical protein